MKQFRLLVAAFAVMLTAPALAQTDEEYNAALENITDGKTYVISTTFNGEAEGSTTYYLTTQGTLTTDESGAGEFRFAKTEVTDGFKAVGWGINNFTNPPGGSATSTNPGYIRTDAQGRNTWERQVFFLNENGKYAVRSTNAASENWGANTYWTVLTSDSDLPNAGYNLTETGAPNGPSYVWSLTDISLRAAKASYEAYKAKVQALEAQEYTDENGAKDALDAAIATQDAAVDAATTTDDITAATTALKSAVVTFLQSVTLTNGNSLDISDALITNATPTSNGEGWTVGADATYDAGNNVAEFWNKSGASISQVVYLPQGTYNLTGIALTRTDMTATLAAADQSVAIATVASGTVNSRTQANNWFNAGNGVNTFNFTLSEPQDVTISLTADNATGDHWMVWRSFNLKYYGANPTGPYVAELNAAVAAAAAVEGTVPTVVYETLNDVVTENNKEYETAEEIQAAIENINNAIAEAVAFQPSYAAYKAAVAKAQADEAKEYTDENDAKAALDAAIAEQNSGIENAASIEEVEAATAAVNAARKTFVYAVSPLNGASFDVTDFFITNATPTTNADGWTVNGNAGFDPANNNAEFWNQSAASISQTLTAVPAGTYELKAIAFTRTDMTATLAAGDESIAIATASSGEANNLTAANTWFNAGNGINTVGFNLDADQDVTISLTADNATGDHWMVWRSFSLNYYGNLDEQLSELNDQYEAFEDALAEDEIPGGAKDIADEAIEELRNADNAETVTGQLALLKALKENIDILNSLKDPYARYKEVRDAMEAIANQEVTYTDESNAKAAFETTVSEQNTIVYNASDSATIADATTAVENALKTFISTVTVTEGRFDVTAFVANASPVNNLDGWTTDNTAWKHENERNVCEYWNETFDFNQTLAALPQGSYAFTMKGFVRQGADNVDLYANADSIAIVQVSGSVVNNQTQADPWLDVEENGLTTVYSALTETGDLKVGVRNAHTQSDGWTIWRSFKLEYLGNDPTLVDNYHAQQALEAAKKALTDAIAEATALAADSANGGEGLFLTPKAAYETLAEAIAPAQAVADNADATLDEVNAALETLNAAIAAFNAAQQKPAAGKTYRVTLKANPDLALSATGEGNGNVKITADGSKIAFEATDGGYYLKADSLYIGAAGTNGWTMSATTEPRSIITVSYVGDGYYTLNVSGYGSIGLDGSEEGAVCYADKSQAKVGDRALWAITENADENTMVININVDRTVGQGYNNQDVNIDAMDYANLLGFLGVDNTFDATVLGINPTTGEFVENAMATYDGWRNKDGDFATWASGDAFVCVKFSPTIESPNTFNICDYPGQPAAGDVVTTKWALQNGDKTVEFDITINFTAPVVYYVEDLENAGSENVTISSQDPADPSYVFSGSVDLNAGFTALDDFMGSFFGVSGTNEEGKTVLTDSYTCDPAPGFWFNNGLVDQWANSQIGVSFMGVADPSAIWAQTLSVNGWIKEALTENQTVQFYLLNSEKTKYYVYNITLSSVSTGITGVNASISDISGNIYSLDGKLVRQNATSAKGLAKGMYINNGRKFVVK